MITEGYYCPLYDWDIGLWYPKSALPGAYAWLFWGGTKGLA